MWRPYPALSGRQRAERDVAGAIHGLILAGFVIAVSGAIAASSGVIAIVLNVAVH